tara:strand:- start:51 stop:242 length:192 start_codon:yes stop_codon:yes gene_type:complete
MMALVVLEPAFVIATFAIVGIAIVEHIVDLDQSPSVAVVQITIAIDHIITVVIDNTGFVDFNR